jgi:hypothetical protein
MKFPEISNAATVVFGANHTLIVPILNVLKSMPVSMSPVITTVRTIIIQTDDAVGANSQNLPMTPEPAYNSAHIV